MVISGMRRRDSRQGRQGRKSAKTTVYQVPAYFKSLGELDVLGALGEKIVRRVPEQSNIFPAFT
jgi:hypothetical protein